MGEQLDFLLANTADPPWRDNRDVMEYPFLSLQKGRKKPIEFRKNNVHLSIAADVRVSIASIWDWDLIIFAASHINDAINAGQQPSPRIRFVPHDCLRQIGRSTGGKDYAELVQAIRRLRMTTVVTNIRLDDGAGPERPFSWLSDYCVRFRYSGVSPSGRTLEVSGGPDPVLLFPRKLMARVVNADEQFFALQPKRPDPTHLWEIELPPWLYNAILRQSDILAVHPDYFQLTGGIERWLYRLARKAVPDNADFPAINFHMDTLHKQSGVTRPLKLFAFDVRKIAERQPLPEYGLRIDRKGKHDLVTFYRDHSKLPRVPRGFRFRVITGG